MNFMHIIMYLFKHKIVGHTRFAGSASNLSSPSTFRKPSGHSCTEFDLTNLLLYLPVAVY